MIRVLNVNQVDILNEILKERKRQDVLHPKNKTGDYLPIIVEELGEIAKAIQDKNITQQREELIQLAAVAVRWLEQL